MAELIFDEESGLDGEWRHSCPGMDSFLSEGGGCIPDFRGGHIDSCDGNNPIPFVFCPFCAEKLPEHETSDCWDCQHTGEYMASLVNNKDNAEFARDLISSFLNVNKT
jgi:hypothetical protein